MLFCILEVDVSFCKSLRNEAWIPENPQSEKPLPQQKNGAWDVIFKEKVLSKIYRIITLTFFIHSKVN